jgi:alpha-L-fucosidase 2
MGWINDGDYAIYFVNSPAAASYTLRASVGSAAENASSIVVKDSAGKELATLKVNPTTGWNDWTVSEAQIALPKGEQKLKFEFVGEDNFLMNVDWFEFTSDGMTIAPAGFALDAEAYPVKIFDVNGKYMGKMMLENWQDAPNKLKTQGFRPGRYVVVDKKSTKLVVVQ